MICYVNDFNLRLKLSIRSQSAADKRKLTEEMSQLESSYSNLQTQIERAIREKRAAESELEKLTKRTPGQIDQLEMTIEELNCRLRLCERERIEALHKVEKYLFSIALH